jgi:hypothetical protein
MKKALASAALAATILAASAANAQASWAILVITFLANPSQITPVSTQIIDGFSSQTNCLTAAKAMEEMSGNGGGNSWMLYITAGCFYDG